MDLEKILPKNGPPTNEVNKYIDKYKNELIVIKLSKIFLSIKTFPPYFITMRSFLYFSMYFETSSIGGPSLGSIFSKSIYLLSYDNQFFK